MKIFYHPKTLKIMGASESESSLSFPYINVEEKYSTLENIAVVLVDGQPTVKVLKGTL